MDVFVITGGCDTRLLKSGEPPVHSRIRIHDLLISIENPKGSIRTKKGSDGSERSRKMYADYGRIVGKRGADGGQCDVFIGEHRDSPNAYIIDQLDRDGKFDEHKCVLGCESAEEARALYLSNYPKGWNVGKVTEKRWPQFLEWLEKQHGKMSKSIFILKNFVMRGPQSAPPDPALTEAVSNVWKQANTGRSSAPTGNALAAHLVAAGIDDPKIVNDHEEQRRHLSFSESDPLPSPLANDF